MTSQLILASQEVHDLHRQQIMQERAGKTAHNLRKQTGVIGVVLSGSVARGPVSESSDLDLHVIVSRQFTGSLSEWTFYKEGTIENLHTVHEDELLRGWHARSNSTSLAAWFYETKLGDELDRFLPLWWDSSTHWQKRLSALVTLRKNPDVVQVIARHYMESARAHIRQARDACEENAPYDSHQHLRLAFQAALTAAMICRGWVIRGSKKRIEIAQAFLPDPLIEPLLVAGVNVVGLKGMTQNQAVRLCKSRLHYRTILLSELHRLMTQYAGDEHIATKLEVAIKHQAQHNTMAYDYYSSLVAHKMILGAVNHIRCLSGLVKVPQILVSCLYGDRPWPIREFVKSGIVSQSVCDAWLEIMALTFSQKQCVQLSAMLSTALNPLTLHLSRKLYDK